MLSQAIEGVFLTIMISGGHYVGWEIASIEDSSHNFSHGSLWKTIKLLRSAIDFSGKNNKATHALIIQQLLSRRFSLLHRVAIYGMENSSLFSPEEKLSWLQNNVNWTNANYHHELYHMLQKIYPLASSAQREKIIQHISKLSFSESDKEHDEYKKFALLKWISRSCPDKHVKSELQKNAFFQKNRGLSDQADFRFYCSTGRETRELPWSLSNLLETSGEKWATIFTDIKDKVVSQCEPEIAKLVREAVSQNLQWGFQFVNGMLKLRDIKKCYWLSEIFDEICKTIQDMNGVHSLLQILQQRKIQKGRPHIVPQCLSKMLEKE